MEPRRKYGIAITLLAMAAWTVYCALFFLTLGTPAIEGGAESTAFFRLIIVGGWLSGMFVGTITIVCLATNKLASVPGASRAFLAAAALVATSVAVIALFWLELSAVLIFFWAPLAAAVLLLMVWAAGPAMRRRIAGAAGAWLIGFAAVAGLLFALPRTLQFHFWTLLGVVTVAVIAWGAWPVFRKAAQRLAAS